MQDQKLTSSDSCNPISIYAVKKKQKYINIPAYLDSHRGRYKI